MLIWIFVCPENRDLLKLILKTLQWEEILVLASTCKSVYQHLSKMLANERLIHAPENEEECDEYGYCDSGRLLMDKRDQLIQVPEHGRNHKKFEHWYVDDEIRYQLYNIDTFFQNLIVNLCSFHKVWEVERKSKSTKKTLFKNAHNHTIISTFVDPDCRMKNKIFTCEEDYFDCMLEYQDENGNIVFQIGTEASHPFLSFPPSGTLMHSFTSFAWVQSDGSSDFPYINTTEQLQNIFPYFEGDFRNLDSKNYSPL